MFIIKNVSLISLLFFVFLLPFSLTIANIGFFVFVLGIFINKDLYKNFSSRTINNPIKYFVFFSFAYWLWCICSLLWTDDFGRGVQLCGRYIMIAAFPLSFYLAKVGVIIKNTKILAWTFIVGVIISSFICLYMSYQDCWHETENGTIFSIDYYLLGLTPYEAISKGLSCFSYNFLSHFVHPAYYSLYFILIVVFLLYEFSKSKLRKLKIIYLIGSIYCLVFLYLLQSRAAFVALCVVLLVLFAYVSFIKKQYKFFLCGIVSFSIVCIFIIPHTRLSGIIDGIEKALEREDNKDLSWSLEEEENTRIIIWQRAFEVIKQHPILGVGIGDTDIELQNEYKKHNLNTELGTHNQYIYAQLSMGIIGLLLLLAMLFTPLYFGIKNRYFPLIGFAVAVMVNLMFENMLTRNAGLMFIPWATMLLLMMSEEKKKEISNE